LGGFNLIGRENLELCALRVKGALVQTGIGGVEVGKANI